MATVDLDDDDRRNLKQIMDELIDGIAEFQSTTEHEDEDFAALLSTLDTANFVIGGIIYANAISLCDHDEDDE